MTLLLFTYVLLMVPWMLAQVCRVYGDSTQYTVVDGLGASLPMSLYLNAFFSYRFVDPSVQVTFDNRPTSQALCRLMDYSKECAANDTQQPLFLDWAAVDTPLPADALLRYPDLQLYPTVAGAIVPIFNLNGITDLVLGMDTLAKIWSGRITTWDHPEIKSSNPNFTTWNIPANQRIALVARADDVGDTQVFKTALAGVDPRFRAQVGLASAPTWNGTQVTLQSGSQLVISYVMRNRYTLGYASMADALTSQIPFAKLNRSGVIVQASTDTVDYALLERGVSFGNNGDSPSHLTADLVNAVNPLAWPITTYTYLAVRKSTLRPGGTCDTVSALVNFWLWFWTSDEVGDLADSFGFSTLPEVVRDYVTGRFKQDMLCGGRVVWQATVLPQVVAYGPGSADLIFEKFDRAYALVNSSVNFTYTALPSDQDVRPLLAAGSIVVSTSPLSALPGVSTLVLGAEAVVGISQYVFTLNGLTLAKILNGDITSWQHADIVALNPTGIHDTAGRVVNTTGQPIVLLQSPTASSAPLITLMRRYLPNYTGAAILAAEGFTDPVLVWSAVLGTPYSFSIDAMAGQVPDELQFPSIVTDSGVAVAPSLETAKACATGAVFNRQTELVTISNGSCYPLLLTLYVNMQSECPTPSDTNARAATFLQWMFSDDTLDDALNALNLVPLDSVSSAIQADNDAALCQLLCQNATAPAPTDIVPLLLAVIIPIVVVVLLGVGGCGWWMWRVTEYNRMLRKKFSNDNVAESCAEAIARFDLAAMAWLKEVKEPNKIQQSFLAIVTLLTEVKPYIPDQLLSRLSAGKSEAHQAEEDNDVEAQSVTSSVVKRGSLRRGGADSFRREVQRKLSTSMRTSRSSMPLSPSPMSPLMRGEKGEKGMRHVARSFPSSDGSKQVAAMKDWARKRCTYLCVRFGSTHHHAEKRLLALAQAAGRIVDIAKAHGATIDSVGVDVVNVHWGVTGMLGASSARAVQASLEIQQLPTTLPEDQQAAFWLQMGIGKGLCDCGTVSSESGHRFFVVWGPEPSLAIEVAAANLPKQVLATLLVSPAVYQEVQFTVQCAPRLWHGDVLLWEPRAVLKKEDDDEWMYELKKMNDGASLGHKVLHEAFLLAKSETASLAEIDAHIAHLRAEYGDTMSLQDSTSLDLLLVMAHSRPTRSCDISVDDAL